MTRFANSVRFVSINLRADYSAVRLSIVNSIADEEKSSDAKEQWNIRTVPSSPACGPHTMLICRTWKLNFSDMGSEIIHTNIRTERQTHLQSAMLMVSIW